MPEIVMTEPTLTIAVLTLNEAKRIRFCLASAQFADQLLVIDSGSQDDTVQIAQSMGAEVHVYADWQGFAVQRNRLLQHTKGKYIFFLDADEYLSEQGIAEIKKIIRSGEDAVWKIKWRTVAFGKELKYLKTTSYVERLFLTSNLQKFEGVVHEKAILLNDEVVRYVLKNPVLHTSRETIYGSLEKMTQYAMLGAAKRLQQGKKGGMWRGIFSSLNIFIKIYFLHRGFLCGQAGFLYAMFHAMEAFFRYVALDYDKDYLNSSIKR